MKKGSDYKWKFAGHFRIGKFLPRFIYVYEYNVQLYMYVKLLF